MKTLTTLLASTGLVLSLGAAASAQENATVAFLMPDQASTRYEQHDYPGFKAEMEKLCASCTVIYQNANADVSLQQQQFNSVIAQGAKVIVLDPVDSAAAAALVEIAQSQDVKVIAYDRPIPDKPANYYVSFDNQGIGKAIAQSLVDHLKAKGVPDGAGVLEINGSPTDAAAGLIRDGIHEALSASSYKTLAEFDTPEWAPPKAQEWTAGQITRFGDQIKGIVAANDGTGGGAIAALKAAGVKDMPPVTGNDATIAALQLIISGDQYNTISKPSEIVAAAAAKVAVALLKGETPEATHKLYETPSQLFVPAVVTAENIKAEIFDKGINKPEEVCTGEYADGCRKLGIISPHMLPSVALCDPELTLGLPPGLTAATGMDAISHCLETYMAPAVNPPADAIAIDGLKRGFGAIRTAVANGSDRKARWEMMMCALEGAMAFQKGLGAVHALTHPLGAIRELNLHHGTLNAVLMPAVLAFNRPVIGEKWDVLAHILGGEPDTVIRELSASIGLPSGLSAMGVTEAMMEQVSGEALKDHCHATNPRLATREDYLDLLHRSR